MRRNQSVTDQVRVRQTKSFVEQRESISEWISGGKLGNSANLSSILGGGLGRDEFLGTTSLDRGGLRLWQASMKAGFIPN